MAGKVEAASGPTREEKERTAVLNILEDLKDSYGKLETAYEELKDLDRLKTNIISNVSHELRTPLMIIAASLELIEDEKSAKTRSDLLNMALKAISRQNQIVEDLVTAAVYRRERIELNLEEVDIGQVVTLVYGKLKRLADERAIEISLKIGDGLPNVRADLNRLEHIIRNLVHNAIKFSENEGRVIIEAKKKKGMVEICVSDTGVGIPKDVVGHVFDLLYQGDSSASRSFEGTGLGLAVVKEIVEAHSGSVTVESEAGRGSMFRFTLPIFKGK